VGRLLLTDIDTSTRSDAQAFQKWNIAWFHSYAYISGVYIFATWLTRPFFQGDTLDYVTSIVAHIRGESFEFWDFGHLLWRPFGWLAFRVSSSVLARFVGSDQRAQVTLVLIVVSWLAGLACALLLLALLRLYCARGWVPQLVVTSFVFSAAELNYSRTGTSYVTGLSLVILAMYLIAREATHPSNSVAMQACAGLALAGSVSIWFLYVLAVPAAVILPFASGAPNKTRFRLSIGTLFFFCVSTALAYVAVLIHLRLSSAAGVMAWVLASSHGIAIRGVSRAIFGWPRSFVNLGDAGRVIKRYLLHDSFNPISARDLLLLWPELLKFGLFYLTLFSIAFNLGRFSRGRKALTMAALAVLPVLGFAIHWSGGDLERYLPLYPAFFLVLTISLADLTTLNWTKVIAWSFVLCVVVTNAVGLRSAVARRSSAQTENRVNGLLSRLSHTSLVIVSHNLDDLMEFSRNFPFNPINRSGALNIYPLLTLGNSDVGKWRESFASRALRSWRVGGDIWISNRLFHRTPQAEWNWVEGDDNRVSWSDLVSFFSHLQYGESIGGADGFVLLLPSAENQRLLSLLDVLSPKESVLLPVSCPPQPEMEEGVLPFKINGGTHAKRAKALCSYSTVGKKISSITVQRPRSNYL
jgi:hypothetical protein